MGPDKIKVPVPVLIMFPLAELSEITPLKVRLVKVVSIWKVPVSPEVMTKGMVLEAVTPVYSSVAFKVTELLCPSGPLVLILLMVAIAKIPADTVRPPVKLLFPDKVKTPVPVLTKLPLDEITPLKVRSLAPLSIWTSTVAPEARTKGIVLVGESEPVYSKMTVLPLLPKVTELLSPSVPLLLTLLMLPMARVPFETVSPPEKVLVFDKVKVPAPVLIKPPLDEITPLKVRSLAPLSI